MARKPSQLENPSARPMLRCLRNVLWFVLGGFVMGVGRSLAIGHLSSALIALTPIGPQLIPMRR
jgi:uncharacterized membrane protein YccF (DUF307 family)